NGSLECVAEWLSVSDSEDDLAAASTPLLEHRDAIEAWLVSQIASRSGLDPTEIDIDQSIDSYGMDSLMAIELMHRIETDLGVVLPMVRFLESPSVSQLVDQALEKMHASARVVSIASLRPGQRDDLHPLSAGQKALWFLHQLAPESTSYNIVGAASIRAELDVAALRRSFQTLVERHAALRTTFTTRNGEPFQ